MQLKQDLLDKFVSQASALMDKAAGTGFSDNLKQDFEASFRVLTENTFKTLDVVSREEFEAQVAVLERTEKKLEQLEQQLDDLLKE